MDLRLFVVGSTYRIQLNSFEITVRSFYVIGQGESVSLKCMTGW